jgi:hypothetical protein
VLCSLVTQSRGRGGAGRKGQFTVGEVQLREQQRRFARHTSSHMSQVSLHTLMGSVGGGEALQRHLFSSTRSSIAGKTSFVV